MRLLMEEWAFLFSGCTQINDQMLLHKVFPVKKKPVHCVWERWKEAAIWFKESQVYLNTQGNMPIPYTLFYFFNDTGKLVLTKLEFKKQLKTLISEWTNYSGKTIEIKSKLHLSASENLICYLFVHLINILALPTWILQAVRDWHWLF